MGKTNSKRQSSQKTQNAVAADTAKGSLYLGRGVKGCRPPIDLSCHTQAQRQQITVSSSIFERRGQQSVLEPWDLLPVTTGRMSGREH